MQTVRIHIQSTIQSEIDQEPEVIEQHVLGRFEIKEDEWVIRYTENEGKDDEIRTTVKSLPHQVTVIRQGVVSYRQTYRIGETVESIVHTPAGTTEMEVTTSSYERERKDRQGYLQFAFFLNMGKQALGNYQLELTWVELEQK